MRFQAIYCQVLSREMEALIPRSPHSIDSDIQPMGRHELGAEMRPYLQARIDAADPGEYDAILLGYGLCGRGTEGLRAGRTPLVLPRAHDCLGILMGGRDAYEIYFAANSGTYYRSPGWVEFSGLRALQPASAGLTKGFDRVTLAELVSRYGTENGGYLYEQFSRHRPSYTRLAYISTGIENEEPLRRGARAEAEEERWSFEELAGSLGLLERLVNGNWNPAEFLVVAPGQTVRTAADGSIVDAE